jgi:hypothetical protein
MNHLHAKVDAFICVFVSHVCNLLLLLAKNLVSELMIG